MGRHSDSNIFSSGALARKMNKQTLQLPQPALLPDYNQTLPFVFVADEAFPRCDTIMRPYSKRNITGNFENKIFNYRLSRARQTVECTFGILAAPFRVFRKPFEIKIESVDNVIKAACVLHNYLRNEITISNNVQGESDIMPDNQLLPLKGLSHVAILFATTSSSDFSPHQVAASRLSHTKLYKIASSE